MPRKQLPTKTLEDVISQRQAQSPFRPISAVERNEWRQKSREQSRSRKSRKDNGADDEEILQELSRFQRSGSSFGLNLEDQISFDQTLSRSASIHQGIQKLQRTNSASPRITSQALVPINSSQVIDRPQSLHNSRRKVAAIRPVDDPLEVEFQQQQIKSIKKQCAELVRRLKSVEKMSSQLKDHQLQELGLPRRVQRSFVSVQHKLYTLGRTFLSGQDKIQDAAATHISRWIRGWLARRKYHRALSALHEWRNQETISLRAYVLNWITNQEGIAKKIDAVRKRHIRRLTRLILREWNAVTVGNTTSNLQLHKKEEQIQTLHWNNVLRRVLVSWRDVALGPHSRKKVVSSYKKRYDEAFHRVALLNIGDEPSQNDIRKEFRKISVALFRQMKTRKIFETWYKLVFNSEENQKVLFDTALTHYMNNLLKRSFNRWRVWSHDMRIMTNSPRFDMPNIRQRMMEPTVTKEFDYHPDRPSNTSDEKWMKRRNKIATIYREQWELQRKVFRIWRHQVLVRNEVERRVKKKQLALKSLVLGEWMIACREQRKVKLDVIRRWIASSLSRLELTFKAWYVWYARKKSERTSKRFLVEAFIRRRNQRLVTSCFKNWRKSTQLSVSESTWLQDDVPDISRRYEEQLHTNTLLKKNVESYRRLLENFESSLKTQEDQFKKKEVMLSDKDNELLSAKFALHNAQMEIQRLKVVMEKSLLKYVVPLKAMSEADAPQSRRGSVTKPEEIDSARIQPLSGPIQIDRPTSSEGGTSANLNPIQASSQGLGSFLSPSDAMQPRRTDSNMLSANTLSAPRRVIGKNALCIVPPAPDVDNDPSLWRSSTPMDDGPPLSDPLPKRTTTSAALLSKVVQGSLSQKSPLPPVDTSSKTIGENIGKILTKSLFDTGFDGSRSNSVANDMSFRESFGTGRGDTDRPKSRLLDRSSSVQSVKADDVVRKSQLYQMSSAKSSIANDLSELGNISKANSSQMQMSDGVVTPPSTRAAMKYANDLQHVPQSSASPRFNQMQLSTGTPPTSKVISPLPPSSMARDDEDDSDSDSVAETKPVESMDLLERAKFVQQALEFLQLDPKSPSPQTVSLLAFLRGGAINHDIKDIEKKIKQQHQTQALMRKLHRASQTVTWGDVLGFVDSNAPRKVD
eukprot:TRINITY_DN7822_c0_g1_i6.p1 TRINITY_DN7822_c0_g1~~TRINITY_DN7822_c0_g1_i6.p1  ORF type:complete len:1142 (+),score=223.18 TRINITY_DN7822_c0_g1_i6:116-3541(+)